MWRMGWFVLQHQMTVTLSHAVSLRVRLMSGRLTSVAELGSMPQALPLHTPVGGGGSLKHGSLSLCCPKNSRDSSTVALRAAQSRSRVDRPSLVFFTEVSLHLAWDLAHSRQ